MLSNLKRSKWINVFILIPPKGKIFTLVFFFFNISIVFEICLKIFFIISISLIFYKLRVVTKFNCTIFPSSHLYFEKCKTCPQGPRDCWDMYNVSGNSTRSDLHSWRSWGGGTTSVFPEISRLTFPGLLFLRIIPKRCRDSRICVTRITDLCTRTIGLIVCTKLSRIACTTYQKFLNNTLCRVVQNPCKNKAILCQKIMGSWFQRTLITSSFNIFTKQFINCL